MRPLFIAEVKTRSPFGFVSPHSRWALLDLAVDAGDIVAAHTEEPWGGSLNWLRVVCAAAHARDKLVLAKGIHSSDDDIRRALHHGADMVLVCGRKPPATLEPVCLWEPSNFTDLAIDGRSRDRIVWNQRNLKTGEARERSFGDARLAQNGWMCQASFIGGPGDVHEDADAFMVGQFLPEFVSRAVA